MNVNSKKILSMIPKFKKLDEKGLDLISSAIDAYLAVQILEEAQKSPDILRQLIQNTITVWYLVTEKNKLHII